MSAITSSPGVSSAFGAVFGKKNSKELSERASNSYVWASVQTAKIQLSNLAKSFGGIHSNVSCFRHFNSQIVPMFKVVFEATPVSRFALPGLVKAYTKLTDVSDCTEFLGDLKYFLNNKFSSDLRSKNVLSIIISTCGAVANVTNTIELMRVWGDYHLKFLGNFGNYVARISVYGSKPFALVGRVTVSGLCSVTLCSTFFFLAVKSHLEVRKLEAEKKKERTFTREYDLLQAKKTRLSAVAKFALYTPMLICGVSNVFVLGALGSFAFYATYKEKISK